MKVLFFATARELAGTSEADLDWAGLTVAEARRALAREYGPRVAALLPSCALWLNAQPAAEGTVLAQGDELAVLPPVSGG